MSTLLNIIVLTFEILYYSLFMKFAKNEGKLWKYIILFIINSVIVAIFGNRYLLTYLIFIFIAFVGLKYIIKTKTNLYDMLIIILMLAFKLVIEFIIYLFLYKILSFNHFLTGLLFEFVKIFAVLSLKDKIKFTYLKLKKKWDNNNFYIRYIFSILMYSYVIITFLLLISNIKK